VSGGLIPASLRGTSSNVVGHIADWYSTICALAGVDHKDDSPIKPLPVDPSKPKQDIYSNGAFPGVDGVDLWPFLVTDPQPLNASAAHPGGLWLSAEVMMRGNYKLVVSQQDPAKTNSGPTLGWKCGGSKHARCNTTVSAECGGEALPPPPFVLAFSFFVSFPLTLTRCTHPLHSPLHTSNREPRHERAEDERVQHLGEGHRRAVQVRMQV
jgi:hypothetical protein